VIGTIRSLAIVALVSLASCSRSASSVVPRSGSTDGPMLDSSALPRGLPDIPFSISNEISDCLGATATGGKTAGNLLLGSVRLETKKIIAHCGCPSRWLIYRAIRKFHGHESQQASGIVAAPPPGAPGREVDVMLEADNEHPEAGSLTVDVGCRPPD